MIDVSISQITQNIFSLNRYYTYMKQQDKVFIIVGSTAVLVAAGITGAWLFGKTDTTSSAVAAGSSTAATQSTTASTTATPATTTSSSSSATSSSGYKDGTYKATANYYVPHGATNSLTASVTISGGKVSSVTVNNNYSDQESSMYIDSFVSAVQNAVVGKGVDGLSPSRIGGASLTTQAFDDALATIRTDAKA